MRTTWTTVKVRAKDLRPGDVARLGSSAGLIWRFVYGVDNDVDLGCNRDAYLEKLGLNDNWTVIRYAVDETKGHGELDDALTHRLAVDLIEIQWEEAS